MVSPVSSITQRPITYPSVTSDKDNKYFDPINEALKESDYQKGIDRLLDCLVACDEITDKSKVYDYLIQLMPHFSDDDYNIFMQHLWRLFQCSSHLMKEQKQLALALADWHIQKASESKDYLSYYNEAMDYFNKAIQIDNQIDLHLQENQKLHCRASQLFLKIIERESINTSIIIDHIEVAIKQNDLVKFQYCLSLIEKIKSFCFVEEDKKMIGILHDQMKRLARENFIDHRPDREPLRKLYISDEMNLNFHLSIEYTTDKYKKSLDEVRKHFTFLPNPENSSEVRHFQSLVSEKYKNFFKQVLEDACIMIGPFPCDYDIRAMGSMGKEPCPYSDLEFFILINEETPVTRKYFNNLAKILEFQILSLGETASTKPAFTSIHSKNPSGFYIDSGGNPAKDADLIHLPQKMAKYQNVENEDINLVSEHPQTIQNTSLTSTSLSCLDSALMPSPDGLEIHHSLFQKYMNNVNEILNTSVQNVSLRKRRALNFFKFRLKDYEKQWPQPFNAESETIHVKEKYIYLLNYLMSDMALYWGIEKTNTFDIIDALVEKEVFTADSGLLLKEAAAQIYYMRIQLHQHYKQQKEEGYLNLKKPDLSDYVFSKEESHQLEAIYWLVLYPLYTILKSSLIDQEIETPLLIEENNLTRSNRNLIKPEKNLDFISSSEKFEQDFHKRDLLDTIFTSKFLTRPLVYCAAAYLTKSGATEDKHKQYYLKLSERWDIEHLREAYLEPLDVRVKKNLLPIPNRGGIRQSLLEHSRQLKDAIMAMTTDQITSVQITLPWSPDQNHYLKQTIIDKILDNGNIKSDYKDSAHHVSSAEFEGYALHFKQEPYHPLMEYAIHNLTTRISGRLLTPASTLVRFKVGQHHSFPVLISQTIKGESLKEVMSKVKLNSVQLSWLALCSILTCPLDGREANYLVDKEGNIYCIDNDISFGDPVVAAFWNLINNVKINFCCAPFCFDQEVLDSSVMQEFKELEGDFILSGWIDDIIAREKEYLSLFAIEERKKFYENNPDKKFTPTILFREGVIAKLNLQFVRLQAHFQAASKDKYLIIDLLKQLIGNLDEFRRDEVTGGSVYQAYKKALTVPIAQRLGRIVPRSRQSMTPLQAQEACFGKPPTLKEIEERQYFSPEKARNELSHTLYVLTEEYTKIRKMDGTASIARNFKSIQREGQPDITRQTLVLKALSMEISTRFYDKPTSVMIHHCAALNKTTLALFLHDNLESLDLSYCDQIVNQDIIDIQRKCPKLKKLTLIGCAGLTVLNIMAPLSLLDISVCSKIQRLNIDAPLPKQLEFKDCPPLGITAKDKAVLSFNKNEMELNLSWFSFTSNESEVLCQLLFPLVDVEEKPLSIKIQGSNKPVDSILWELLLHEKVENLTVTSVVLNNEMIKTIQFLSPRLKELRLTGCQGTNLLLKHIHLEKLTFINCSLDSLILRIPCLKEFRYDGNVKKCSIDEMESFPKIISSSLKTIDIKSEQLEKMGSSVQGRQNALEFYKNDKKPDEIVLEWLNQNINRNR